MLLLALAGPSMESASMKMPFSAVRASTALLGPSLEPVSNAVVLVHDGLIRAVGRADDVDLPPGCEFEDATGLTILPGFIDTHVHIGFAEPHVVLARGVTTARDLAWPPAEIWDIVERSRSREFDGPQIFAAGQMLTVRDGYPMRAPWAPAGTGRVVDGPADAEVAVQEQVHAGASVVKVALNAATGPTLDPDTLGAIVRAAHTHSRRVTAHVTGLAELLKALAAGVDELAHMLMSPERLPGDSIGQMISEGVTIVPTLACRFGRDREIAIDNLRRFVSAGGRVIYGTDLGNEGPIAGIDAREIDGMARAGMSGEAIVASATTEAAAYLALVDRGVLEPGRQADMIAVRGNPLSDPHVLVGPEIVWRAGRAIRPSRAAPR